MASPGLSSSVDGCNAADAQRLGVVGSPVLGSVGCVNGRKKSSAVVVSLSLQGTVSLKMPLMWINFFRISHGRLQVHRRVGSCSSEVSVRK